MLATAGARVRCYVRPCWPPRPFVPLTLQRYYIFARRPNPRGDLGRFFSKKRGGASRGTSAKKKTRGGRCFQISVFSFFAHGVGSTKVAAGGWRGEKKCYVVFSSIIIYIIYNIYNNTKSKPVPFQLLGGVFRLKLKTEITEIILSLVMGEHDGCVFGERAENSRILRFIKRGVTFCIVLFCIFAS